MTKLEQLKVQKALLQGQLRLLERQLAQVEAVIGRVQGSIHNHKTLSFRNNVGVSELRLGGGKVRG